MGIQDRDWYRERTDEFGELKRRLRRPRSPLRESASATPVWLLVPRWLLIAVVVATVLKLAGAFDRVEPKRQAPVKPPAAQVVV